MKKRVLLLLPLTIYLQGCVPIIVGAAAAGASGATYYNRSSLSNFFDDSDIVKSAYRKIQRNPELSQGTHIVIAAKDGNVLIVGQVPNPEMKNQVENVVRSVDGVKMIFNQLTVSGPSADLVRSSDSWITTKIKSQLVVTKNIHANQIKVITENGVVFLMGTSVSQDAQDSAVNIARQIIGVQKVVKLFV